MEKRAQPRPLPCVQQLPEARPGPAQLPRGQRDPTRAPSALHVGSSLRRPSHDPGLPAAYDVTSWPIPKRERDLLQIRVLNVLSKVSLTSLLVKLAAKISASFLIGPCPLHVPGREKHSTFLYNQKTKLCQPMITFFLPIS